jgi:hypothetical protein
MFISECILPGETIVASRQEGTNSLHISTRSVNDIFINIHGATREEVDAIADAINAPITRMRKNVVTPAEAA